MQLTVVVRLGRDLCFLTCLPLAPSFILNGVSCVLPSTCHGPDVAVCAVFNLHIYVKERLVFSFHHGETEAQHYSPS